MLWAKLVGPLTGSISEASRATSSRSCRVGGAEAWFNFGRQVTNGELNLIRDETLIAQLTSRKTSCDSRGRIKLESKDELRARGLKSPDRADGVVGAFAMRGAGGSSNYLNNRRRDWMGEMETAPTYGSDEALLREIGGFTG